MKNLKGVSKFVDYKCYINEENYEVIEITECRHTRLVLTRVTDGNDKSIFYSVPNSFGYVGISDGLLLLTNRIIKDFDSYFFN